MGIEIISNALSSRGSSFRVELYATVLCQTVLKNSSSEKVERSTNHSAGELRLMVELKRHSQVALRWWFQSVHQLYSNWLHPFISCCFCYWALSQPELIRAEIIQSKWMMGMKWAHCMEESKLFNKFIEHFAQSSFKFKINFIAIFSSRCNIYEVNTLFQSFFAPSSFLYVPICQPLTSLLNFWENIENWNHFNGLSTYVTFPHSAPAQFNFLTFFPARSGTF